MAGDDEKGGTAAEAKKLADEFQEAVVEVMLERRIKEQNDIIIAKSLRHENKRAGQKPNEFVTNDDFCPSCSVGSRACRENKQTSGRRSSSANCATARIRQRRGWRWASPACCYSEGGDLSGWLGADAAYIDELREDIDALEKKMPPSIPFVHGVREREARGTPASIRGNPYQPGREVPRHFLASSPPAIRPFSKGSGRLELAERHHEAADRHARDRQSDLEVALRHRNRRTPQ